MKKIYLSTYFIGLLTSFIIYSVIKTPSFPDSIVILILSGLVFLLKKEELKEVPDIREEVKKLISQKDSEISEIKNEMGKLGMSVTRSIVSDKIRF